MLCMSFEIVNDNWDLDFQLQSLENWLIKNADFHFADGEWIVDVGYDPKPDTSVGWIHYQR